jgi:lipopolysaccharide transport system ATP-binding protein
VDEVLAVGDAAFQKKCLGKMGDVATKEGRTVLFVSHNMGAIERLCETVLLLERGESKGIGRSNKMIRDYLGAGIEYKNEIVWNDRKVAPGDNFIRVHKISVKSDQDEIKRTFDIRKPVNIEIEFWNLIERPKVACGIHLFNAEGLCLFSNWDFNFPDWPKRIMKKGLIRSTCIIPGNLLPEDRFMVSVAINTMCTPPTNNVALDQIISFEIFDPGEGDSVRGELNTPWTGIMRPMLHWNTVMIEEANDLF